MADRQLAKKGKSGVDNTFRRTWDTDDYAQRAAKREKEVTCHISHVVIAGQAQRTAHADPNWHTTGEGY